MTNNIKRIARFTPSLSKGFTLVETLVAVLLLSVAIAGPLTIASRGLNAALIAKDQVTAFYLAQDAVEYIRFKRDTTCLTNSPCTTWLGSGPSSLSLCASANGSAICYVDSIANTIKVTGTSCTGSALRYDSTAGRNYYSNGSTGTCSPYKRTVKIINPLNGRSDEAQLIVTIIWSDVGGTAHNVTVKENLLNWQ